MTCSSSVKPHKATERYWRQSRQLIEEGSCATTGAGWLQGLSCREVGVGVRMMWCGHEACGGRWFYVSEMKGDIFQVYLIIIFLVIHINVIIIVFVNIEGVFVIIIIAIIFPIIIIITIIILIIIIIFTIILLHIHFASSYLKIKIFQSYDFKWIITHFN